MKFIDTHTHILKKYYKDNYLEEFEQTFKELDFIVNIATDKDELVEMVNLKTPYDQQIFFAFGIHPNIAKEYDLNYEKLLIEAVENNSRVKAIGEIGLDYFYDDKNKEIQKSVFNQQIKIARKYNLPIIIHARDALDDLYLILKENLDLKFLLHSWNQPLEIAEKFINLDNVYFGFNGIITFNSAKNMHDSLFNIPLERIVFETDSPYLTPVPFRGKSNRSLYVRYVYEFYSKLLNIDIEELKKQINTNFKKFFNI